MSERKHLPGCKANLTLVAMTLLLSAGLALAAESPPRAQHPMYNASRKLKNSLCTSFTLRSLNWIAASVTCPWKQIPL